MESPTGRHTRRGRTPQIDEHLAQPCLKSVSDIAQSVFELRASPCCGREAGACRRFDFAARLLGEIVARRSLVL